MMRVPYNFNAAKNLEILSKAAFLTTKSGNKINTMVIGWGSIGVLWRLPIFNVVVRQNRFTYELLEQTKEFTVRKRAGLIWWILQISLQCERKAIATEQARYISESIITVLTEEITMAWYFLLKTLIILPRCKELSASR